MMDKYSVRLHPEVKRLWADPMSAKSSVWQYVFAITPYVLTLAITGKPPSPGPKFHAYNRDPELRNPTSVDIFRLQEALKQCGRVGSEVLLCSGSTASNLSMVVWCRFLPSGKRTKHILEVRAVMDKSGVFILELFMPEDR